ncbi:MAG: T9SS type A sorting domain-containing protein [Candidatus Cloacimonadota bacterium]|nr:MAG: T9SS type A sorting domain-containing protein [Candidatus Cloacimonadota bacterium]
MKFVTRGDWMKQYSASKIAIFLVTISAITFNVGYTQHWITSLKQDSGILKQHVFDQEKKIFERDPLAKLYISRPSRRNILGQKFAERLKTLTPDMARQLPETLRILALRLNFLEDSTSLTTGNGKINLEPDTSFGQEYEDGERNLWYEPAHDSFYFHFQLEALRNYYWDDSNHKLWLEWKLVPEQKDSSYTLPHKMTYYGDPYNFVSGLFNLLKDAIAVSDTDTQADIDFSDYDAYLIFHAGSMWQTDWGDSPYDLAAVYIGGADYFFGEPIFANNRTDTITDAVLYCETAKQDGFAAFIQGGLTHEFGHQIGLPDLYDTQGRTMGVGGWALMGTGNWNLDGLVPPHTCAYAATFNYSIHPHTNPNDKLRFIDPVVVDHDTTGIAVSYRGIFDSTATMVVKIPINAHEFFLVANRYTYMNPDTFHTFPPDTDTVGGYAVVVDSNGFRVWKQAVLIQVDDYDISLPPEANSGGLAIWHIDEHIVETGFNDSMNAINAGSPKGVDMEEADGVQDFEKLFYDVYDINATFYGTPHDVFFSGGVNDKFTASTIPNTDDNAGGKSHLMIHNISEPGEIMTFDVTYNWRQDGFPVFHKDGFDVNSPIVYDLDNNDTMEIIIGTVGYRDTIDTIAGRLLIFNYDGTPYTGHPEGVVAEFISGGYWYYTYSTVGIGDINGDGHTDIISAATNGLIYVWQADSIIGTNIGLLDTYQTNGAIITTPLIADINGDGIDDIIIGSDDMRLYALTFQADSLVPIAGFPVLLGQWIWSTPILINDHLFVFTNDGLLYKINTQGEIIWQILTESLSFTASSPVAGDMDRDGIYEIVVSTGRGEIISIDEQGIIEWSRTIKDTTFYATPAISDLDGDGFLDVVIAAGTKIYAFDKNGSLLNGFPISSGDSLGFQSSITLGDLDDDGIVDILIGSLDRKIHAFNYKGEKLAGFPLTCGGKAYSTPCIVNLDGDPYTEIIAAGDNSGIYAWKLPSLYRESSATWSFLRRDAKHNALYPESLLPENTIILQKLISKESFYVYPNPIIGNHGTIRYLLGEDIDGVSLTIFNVAGDILRKFQGKKEEGFNENEVNLWDIAPGIYICQVAVEKGTQRVVYNKKFAIVK